MAAKKKPIENKSLSDLGISASDVGGTGAWSAVDSATPRPPREKGIKVDDGGDGGSRLADYLVEKRLV